MQVAKGSFSHIALIVLSILDKRICNLQGSFSGQGLTDVPYLDVGSISVVLGGLTPLKSQFADDGTR